MTLKPHSPLAIAAVVLALLLLLVSTARLARPSSEAVRLRNALLFDETQAGDLDWTPAQVPSSFATDAGSPDRQFANVVQSLGLAGLPDDRARVVRISQHLLEKANWGHAALADLAGTYAAIRNGRGYCSDFTTVFIAIAHSAGIFAREWAFSFDGFGGYGHALVEYFDRDTGQWAMLDVFNNWMPLDAVTGQTMPVSTFRQRLLTGRQDVRVLRLGPARFGFRDEADLWRYYQRGADQWYLWWGNAVFAYDSAPPSRMFGGISRSLEQLGAVAWGTHPRIRPVPTPTNAAMRKDMHELKLRLLLSAAIGTALVAMLSWQLWCWQRSRRSVPKAAYDA
jgi:Transglutaminase-like superfamily